MRQPLGGCKRADLWTYEIFVIFPDVANESYAIQENSGIQVIIFSSDKEVIGIDGKLLGGKEIRWRGYGILGIWIVGLNIQAGIQHSWPHRLIWFGIATGAIMAVGVRATPKVIIPYVSLYHQLVPELGELIGSLGWRFLYPVWVIWLAGASQKSRHNRPALQGSGS